MMQFSDGISEIDNTDVAAMGKGSRGLWKTCGALQSGFGLAAARARSARIAAAARNQVCAN